MTAPDLCPLDALEPATTVELVELRGGCAQLLVRRPGAGVVVVTLAADTVVELGRRCLDGGAL